MLLFANALSAKRLPVALPAATTLQRSSKQSRLMIAIVTTLLFAPFALANSNSNDNVGETVKALQKRWAEVNYQLRDKAQKQAFEELINQAEQATVDYPQAAETWIWSGIIKSSYAGAKGGLGALSLAKDSRKDLDRAMDLNPNALSGSAYTSLGTLYFKVPGWPLGFGDRERAEELLKKALTLNPDGIDSNYFYAEFLRDQGKYEEAERYLLKAEQAPPRPQRPLADAGRRKEISVALHQVREKLNK
jgi:tetratricopeptide (TPR) repeat protein